MASHRPYRPALGIEMALEEVQKNRGTLYDPNPLMPKGEKNVCVKT